MNFTPAGAQWSNGAVETFVKKFKKSFEALYSKARIYFAEIACAVKLISGILNERSLSVQISVKAYANTDFLTPITPNMLLTGKSGNLAPVQQAYLYDDCLSEGRLSFEEELE